MQTVSWDIISVQSSHSAKKIITLRIFVPYSTDSRKEDELLSTSVKVNVRDGKMFEDVYGNYKADTVDGLTRGINRLLKSKYGDKYHLTENTGFFFKDNGVDQYYLRSLKDIITSDGKLHILHAGSSLVNTYNDNLTDFKSAGDVFSYILQNSFMNANEWKKN